MRLQHPNDKDKRDLYIPDDIIFGASGDDRHLLLLHDVLELGADFASLAEQLGVQEMLHGPVITEPDVQQSK